MISAELPHNEVDRLKNLYSYCILDSEKEEDFDAITTLAAQIFKVPICVITLLDKERQWFKSKVGIEINETPRNISFCGHAILTQNELMVVKNAHDDIRFKDNPLVIDEPHLVFYAGAPIISEEGFPFGTLCILDFKEHDFSDQQKSHLMIMAKQVSNLLNLRKRNKELHDALNEKAVLMKEIHHRVKNNLQIISSLLNLQIRTELDFEATNALESSRDRIMAMSFVHQQLYQNNSIDLVDFDKYLEQLVDSIQHVHSNIMMEVNCENIELYTDIAVPLSLIVSEVITNACKHGFHSRLNGKIQIDIIRISEDVIELKIKDNGNGFSKEKKWDQSSTLGFEIIKTLTDQINGEVECRSSSKGTCFTFNFNLQGYHLPIRQTA